jgi:hypothetical protein
MCRITSFEESDHLIAFVKDLRSIERVSATWISRSRGRGQSVAGAWPAGGRPAYSETVYNFLSIIFRSSSHLPGTELGLHSGRSWNLLLETQVGFSPFWPDACLIPDPRSLCLCKPATPTKTEPKLTLVEIYPLHPLWPSLKSTIDGFCLDQELALD